MLEWLEDYGIEDAWKLAEPLSSSGIEVATLDNLIDRWRDDNTEMRDLGIRWLALSFDVLMMITSGLHGAQRMSELVQSMKSYSHLDRGVQQSSDIHEGIEDTLRLFAFKLKQGIEIRRNYDPTKAVGKGTGLGLESARRIVENRHRGSLSFQSQSGQTRFTVCLPIGDAAR